MHHISWIRGLKVGVLGDDGELREKKEKMERLPRYEVFTLD